MRFPLEDVDNAFAPRWTADGKWDDWSYAFQAPVNRDWQLYRQVFAIPPTTRYAAFRVWIERFQGTAWFDEVRMSEYEPAEPGFVDDLTDAAAWRVWRRSSPWRLCAARSPPKPPRARCSRWTSVT